MKRPDLTLHLRPLAALMLLGLMAEGQAAGLGNAVVHSYLGGPLRAEIPLRLAPDETIDASCISLLPGHPELGDSTPADLHLRLRTGSRPALLAESQRAVNEPFVTLRVRLECNGTSIRREYALLIDPPPPGADAGVPDLSTPDVEIPAATANGQAAPATAGTAVLPAGLTAHAERGRAATPSRRPARALVAAAGPVAAPAHLRLDSADRLAHRPHPVNVAGLLPGPVNLFRLDGHLSTPAGQTPQNNADRARLRELRDLMLANEDTLERIAALQVEVARLQAELRALPGSAPDSKLASPTQPALPRETTPAAAAAPVAALTVTAAVNPAAALPAATSPTATRPAAGSPAAVPAASPAAQPGAPTATGAAIARPADPSPAAGSAPQRPAIALHPAAAAAEPGLLDQWLPWGGVGAGAVVLALGLLFWRRRAPRQAIEVPSSLDFDLGKLPGSDQVESLDFDDMPEPAVARPASKADAIRAPAANRVSAAMRTAPAPAPKPAGQIGAVPAQTGESAHEAARKAYLNARFPEIAAGLIQLENADSVVQGARLYVDHHDVDRAEELLESALLVPGANDVRPWLALFELHRRRALIGPYILLLERFRIRFPDSRYLNEVLAVGRQLDPKRSEFSPPPGAAPLHGPVDGTSWLEAELDFVPQALAQDLRDDLMADFALEDAGADHAPAQPAHPGGR